MAFLLVLLVASGVLAGAFSARQPLVVAADVALSGMHFSLLFLILIWVQDLLLKDTDRKTIDWILAYPVHRSDYLLGKLIGLAALLAGATLLLAVPVWVMGHWGSWGYADSSRPVFGFPFAWVLWGVWLESLVILAFAVFVFSVSTTPYLPLAAALCFALAGRSLGGAFDFLLFNPDATPEFKANMLPILQAIRWILPDLSMLDWRASMLYNSPLPSSRFVISLMALAYTGIFSVLALALFKRRQTR